MNELELKIEAKKAEIEKYKGILLNYHGRWWDQSKRYLESLEAELKDLEKRHAEVSNQNDQ